MTRIDRSIVVGVLLATTVSALALAATPAAATSDTTPAAYEFDGANVLIDGPITEPGGTVTLRPDGNATEGDTVRLELDDNHPGFAVESVSDATTDDVGVSLHATDDAVEITLTDLGGDGSLSGTELAVDVDLTATDTVAGRAHEYDSTPIAAVTADETDGDLTGATAIEVTVDPSAGIEFDADEIDEEGDYLPIYDRDPFIIEFGSDGTTAADGDKINLSVDPDSIAAGDEDSFTIHNSWEGPISSDNISDIEISLSKDANVLDGYSDQITVTIRTDNDGERIVSDGAVVVWLRMTAETEQAKSAADRYRNTDLLTVDVEGENNAGLTDNDDIRTESPVRLDVHPGEPSGEGFELGIDSGEEFGVGENRSVSIDGLEDDHGNAIPRADVEFTVDASDDTTVHETTRVATNGTESIPLDGAGALDVPLGRFDLSAAVTDVVGPAEVASEPATETASDAAIYPDNVRVDTTTAHNDFDADGDGTIEVAVDLGVPDGRIGAVDIELRRTSGDGTVGIADGGTPTATAPWTETGYDGDDRLGTENPWVIERDLTAADFESGVRRYVLDADAAARYGIVATVMPHDGAIVPDADEVDSSLAADPGDGHRGSVEIVATGPIDDVSAVSVGTDREFVGVTAEEGGAVELGIEGFEDGNGYTVTDTDDTVSVRFGGVAVGDVAPTPGEGAATTTVDPTAIDSATVDTGTEATVELRFEDGERAVDTELTLVHRTIERTDGTWQAGSIPQPATIHVDAEGGRDLVQWDPETGSYEGIAAEGSGDALSAHRVGHEDLHRGFYAYAEEGPLRVGFDYATSAEGSIGTDELELDDGWHLASSNYDVSGHPDRDLEADVNWVDYGFGDDAFAVWNADRTDRLHDATDGVDIDGASAPIGHDEAYWIEVDADGDPLTRSVVSPTFSDEEGEE